MKRREPLLDFRLVLPHTKGDLKRRLKQFGVMLVGVLVLLAAYLAVEHVRGKLALNRRLRELSAAGEQLSIEALRPPSVPGEQNAAIEFNALTNSRGSTNLDAIRIQFAAPGKAVVPWRLNEWRIDPSRTNNWSNVGAELATVTQTLRTIHSAARKPALNVGFSYEKGFVDFHLVPLGAIKNAAQVLNLATLYELHGGRRDVAHEHLIDLLGIVSQNTEPVGIYQFVRQACAALAFNETWAALQSDGWTDEQLAAWQSGWTRADFVKDMSRALEMERAMTLAHFRLVKSDERARASLVRESEESPMLYSGFATKGIALYWINLPLCRIAWLDQDCLRALDRCDDIIKHDRFARSNSWAALEARFVDKSWTPVPQRPEPYTWWDNFRFPFCGVSFGITDDHFLRKPLSWETQKHMVVTAIALRRFQLRTGQLPVDLNALMPAYMSALPRDEMNGGVLPYRKASDESFVLYSVGFDGRDDGGDPTPRNTNSLIRFRQIWDGRDAVWPMAATADEITAAMIPQPTQWQSGPLPTGRRGGRPRK